MQNSLEKFPCLSLLSGQVWDKYFIDELNNNIKPDNPLSQIICKLTGDPNENDKVGECVTWMIKHNAPSYIAKNLKNPNFSLNFGAAPFTDSKEELFTKINGLINNKHDEADIWGIDFSNTRLNLKKYQNIIDSEKNNDYLPVLINKTLARNYKLKTGDKINFNYLYDQVNITKDNSSNPLDIKQLSSNFVTPDVNPDSDPENVGKWNYDGKKEDLLTDSSASSFYYNQDNYFCLNSNNYLKDGKISESKIPENKNLKVVGITNDYGYERFYTEKSLLNELLEPGNNLKSQIQFIMNILQKIFLIQNYQSLQPPKTLSHTVFFNHTEIIPL
ncbi:hypothetical protein JTY60_00145 [symbiont of Argiope bruennichi]|uniref:hypothetical protein n=1 Tax=symbiont of Argiope bruennichi TaxID=2810479 RepID=UPI003DA60AA8